MSSFGGGPVAEQGSPPRPRDDPPDLVTRPGAREVAGASRGRGSGFRRLSLAVALLGSCVLLAATVRYGIGVSPDSTVYFSGAESLSVGRGLVQFDGTPLVHWAPLYPALLSLPARVGVPPTETARVLNIVLYGIFLYLCGVWLGRRIDSSLWLALGLVAVLVSTTVLRDFLYAWSEPVFLVLVMLFVLDLERWQATGARAALYRSAVWAALGSLARYPGVTLGMTAVALVLLGPRGRGAAASGETAGRRLVDGTVVGGLGFLPLGLWLARNLRVSGELFGERATSSYSPAQSLFFVLDGASRMFLPPNLPAALRVAVLAAGVAALVVLALRHRRGEAIGSTTLLPALSLVGIYFATLVVWTANKAVEPSDAERYLSPIYALLVGLAILALRPALQAPPEASGASGLGPRGWLRLTMALAVCALGLVYPAARSARQVARGLREGVAGYTNAHWRGSPLAAALRERPLEGIVFSNAPDAVAYLSGQPARLIPREAYDHPPRPGGGADFERVLRSSRATYLVWFSTVDRPVLYSLEELRRIGRLTPLGGETDGEIYRIEFRPSAESVGDTQRGRNKKDVAPSSRPPTNEPVAR